MTTQPSFIIVGGGLAAQTLREEGFDGRITLLGEQPHRPYERPPLSKDYLQGKADRDGIFAHPEPWYADQAVELRLGTAVTSLDSAARTVTTASGVQLGYDKLLLTTGSTPRRLSVITDQYDFSMEYTGDIGPAGYNQVIFRHYPDPRQLIVFWLQKQRVQAGMNVNIWDVADDIEGLIELARSVNTDDLADRGIPLDSFALGATT